MKRANELSDQLVYWFTKRDLTEIRELVSEGAVWPIASERGVTALAGALIEASITRDTAAYGCIVELMKQPQSKQVIMASHPFRPFLNTLLEQARSEAECGLLNARIPARARKPDHSLGL